MILTVLSLFDTMYPSCALANLGVNVSTLMSDITQMVQDIIPHQYHRTSGI